MSHKIFINISIQETQIIGLESREFIYFQNVFRQMHLWCWIFVSQNGPIISRDTGRCLEVEMSKEANFGLRLVVQRCSGQKWMIRNWIKHPRHWGPSYLTGSLCWRVAIDSNPESEVKSRTHVRSVVSSGTHFQGKTLSIETSKDEIESLDVGQRLNQKAIITGKRLAVLTLVENS